MSDAAFFGYSAFAPGVECLNIVSTLKRAAEFFKQLRGNPPRSGEG
jgi:hypothetical protein